MMSPKLVTIGPDDSVEAAQRLFELHGFHHLLVLAERQLVGVVSDRDLLRNLSPFVDKLAERPQDLALLQRRVHQIMARQPIVIGEEAPLDVAACMMQVHDVSCLPVVGMTGRPVGILTRSDLLRGLASCAVPAEPAQW